MTRYGTDPAGNALDRFGLSRPGWRLGWGSFFTDTASEMVYPRLPLFLTRVLGASAMSLGVIEGVAEAANSILKIVSGRIADRTGQPKKLVLAGYGLSSLVRPLMGFVTRWPQVLALRFTHRLGKGIRTSPRDALLARFARAGTRGRVYGFHRSMDHAGAVAGPLVATAFLYFYPEAYRPLFMWTLVPGLIVIALILRLPDQKLTPVSSAVSAVAPRASRLPPRFYRAVAVITLFSLGNASDAFVLLRLNDVGVAVVWIPLLWSALHVVKMTSSVLGGALSARFGRRSLIALGYLCDAAIYAAFAWFSSLPAVVVTFLVYGLYFGLTEGVEKAWVADMSPEGARGTAFGIYNAALGVGGLAASLLFGALWTRVSPAAAFLTGAGFALAASVLLSLGFSNAHHSRHYRRR